MSYRQEVVFPAQEEGPKVQRRSIYTHGCPLTLSTIILMTSSISLVPRLPDLFNVAQEKRGSLVKLITCMMSGGTNFHIWRNSELSSWRCREFKFFDQYITNGYKSANRDASFPSLRVQNCDLHGNLIVSTRRWNRLRRGHDRVTVQITVFYTQRRD